MGSKKIMWIFLILIFSARITGICALAEENTKVLLHYYLSGHPPKELMLTDVGQIEKMNLYWKEYRNFPELDFSEDTTPLSGEFYGLTYFYPNGDVSHSISVFENNRLQVTEYSEPKVYRDANNFYKFLMGEHGGNEFYRKCTDPKLTVIHSKYSGRLNPMWDVCDEDTLNQYLSYIKVLRPVFNIRSCYGMGNFIVWARKEDLGIPKLLYICEDVVSEYRNSGFKSVQDKQNLYQYLKTQFLEQLQRE